jgi:hypothetical protein
MKQIIKLISVITLLATSICNAASPEEEAKFLASVRAAISDKNKEAYMALHCLDRVTDEQKASVARDAEFLFSKTFQVFEIRDLDPSRPKELTRDGVRYSPNLESTKMLYMEYTSELNTKAKIQKNIGEKDGKMMLVILVPKS